MQTFKYLNEDFIFCFILSQVITAFQNVDLSADSRKEMEEWIIALKSVSSQTSSVSCNSLNIH